MHRKRNILSIAPRASQEMVASVIRTIFAQPGATHAQAQPDEVIRMPKRSHPKVAQMLHDARDDQLAFCGYPPKHWQQIWSRNPNASTGRPKAATMSGECSASPAALLSRRATQRVGGLHSPLPLRGTFAATGGPERDPHRRLRRRSDGVIPVPELTVANQKG
ncbi:transposase [Cryobacterium sp. MP_M3]|uniref:transposase n=1 Tax=unclassified Cryobacterium TaxID=2649013 RepID=UPI0018CAA8EE